MKNKKKIILGVLVGVLIGTIISVTYAIFSYTATSNNEQLITGDIYMHYKESNTLTLENALPSTTYDSTKYFEFTIDGKNTNTLYDIYYDILLNRGDVPTGKQETNRIQDKFIKFRLTEFVENETTHELEETEIFTNKKYNDLSSAKRIHVATIPKNTMSEITHRYRLYMWIGNEVVIGNTGNSGIDYDMATWNNLFASIKVSSTGDFEEREVNPPTPASCFTTTDNGNNTVTVTGMAKEEYKLNKNMTTGELQTCANYIANNWQYKDYLDSGTTGETFCQGTGTAGYSNFEDSLIYGFFTSEELLYLANNNIIILNTMPSECNTKDIVIPSEIDGKIVTAIGSSAFHSNQLTSVVIPNSVTSIGLGAFAQNQLTSVEIPNSVTFIDGYAFANNQLTSVVIPNSITDLCGFNNNRLRSVVIPNSVTLIGDNAFEENQLTSIEIPNSVTTIGSRAFAQNQLTSVEIPNSVTTLVGGTFEDNQLTSVTIGNGITSIGSRAFSKSSTSNPNLASITINKSCNDIKNNLLSGSTNYYPWLSGNSPYTASGVTVYGSGNAVCDAF